MQKYANPKLNLLKVKRSETDLIWLSLAMRVYGLLILLLSFSLPEVLFTLRFLQDFVRYLCCDLRHKKSPYPTKANKVNLDKKPLLNICYVLYCIELTDISILCVNFKYNTNTNTASQINYYPGLYSLWRMKLHVTWTTSRLELSPKFSPVKCSPAGISKFTVIKGARAQYMKPNESFLFASWAVQ